MAVEIQHLKEQIVDANSLQLNYDSFGDPANPVILLIMGLGTQMIHWDSEFCKLLAAQNYWVIRFDNRDIGRSSWLREQPAPGVMSFLGNSLFGKNLEVPYQLTDMAEDTLCLMDALNIEKAHIVGASMGGMIAQCIALNSPQRVMSLTSIMSTTGNRSLPKPSASFSAKLIRPISKELEKYVKQTTRVWRLLHGEYYSFNSERVEALVRESNLRGYNPAGVIRQLGAILSAPDRTNNLAKLQLPCLVIHGDSDPLVPVECGYASAIAIPDSELKIFSKMGHTLPHQLWPEIVEAIVSITRA